MSEENRNHMLLREIALGDSEALDALVCENMGLVKSIALRFRDRGVEYEDLVQIGTIGMIKASYSFDFSFGSEFSTYAVPLITGEILRFLRDDGAIKISRTIKSRAAGVMRAREKFIAQNGREPKLSELGEICSLSVEEISEVIDASVPVRSIFECVGNDQDGLRLCDIIPDKNEEIEKLTDSLALHEAIKRLDDTQREIVALRYYKNYSQQQTGKILGLSQVKISREEKKIMRILREAL